MKKKVKKVNHQQLLTLFLKVLAELYPFDRLAPGICLAYLPKDKCYYGSVLRYESEQLKQVLVSCKMPTVQEVVLKLVNDWKARNVNSLTFKKAHRLFLTED